MGGRVNWVWVSTQTAHSSDGSHEGRRVPADPMLQRSLSLTFFLALEVFSFPLSPHFRSLHVPPFCGRVILPRKCTLLRVLNPSLPFISRSNIWLQKPTAAKIPTRFRSPGFDVQVVSEPSSDY